MPFQNRVTPFGEIVAAPERGMLTGNRGVIHDPLSGTLLTRRWASKAWIACDCGFKGRRRTVMGPGWTNLFFLDEATALATGHRPCFECRRADSMRFRSAWANGASRAPPSAPEMDTVLHAERLDGRAKRLHALVGPLAGLPDGAMVADGDKAFLIVGGKALPWSFAGYGARASLSDPRLLTPPSIVRALRAGYVPGLHPTARAAG